MSNKVLIDIMIDSKHDAGTKARNDVAKILNKMEGFDTTVMFNRKHNNALRMLEAVQAVRTVGRNVSENDLILLQYPYHPRIMQMMITHVSDLRRKKKCKLVYLIHDVVYLRNESYVSADPEDMKKTEVTFFNSADALIVHNSAMKKELLSAGVTTPMFELGLFDYLYEGPSAKILQTPQPIIVFAGNLNPEKSGFIYRMNSIEGIHFNLYGSMPGDLATSFDYKGSFPPEELIASIEGNYGLVWDGPSIEGCEGNYGNYLRYNNPHKLSLYIAAGLPAIVWSESALADYVTENKLGIAVSSLDQLNSIPVPGTVEYQEMLNGIKTVLPKLRKGEMLRSVIAEIKLRG